MVLGLREVVGPKGCAGLRRDGCEWGGAPSAGCEATCVREGGWCWGGAAAFGLWREVLVGQLGVVRLAPGGVEHRCVCSPPCVVVSRRVLEPGVAAGMLGVAFAETPACCCVSAAPGRKWLWFWVPREAFSVWRKFVVPGRCRVPLWRPKGPLISATLRGG